MKDLIPGKALVFQSGGPTRVINYSLYGVVDELMGYAEGPSHVLQGIYGSLHGVRGILDENFTDLLNSDLGLVKDTPGSALGTTRHELTEKIDGQIQRKEEDIDRAINVLREHNIRYIFTIGGGDSAETAQVLSQAGEERDYKLWIVHVPKTVDNDLILTDHCPGYPSIATFDINYVLGTYFDARSNGNTIDINDVMGRNAGWVAASAAKCRARGYNPLIITPENPMDINEFVELVVERYREEGLLQVVVSEGARNGKGEWGEQLANDIIKSFNEGTDVDSMFQMRRDAIGRAVLSDMSLAKLLAPRLKKATGARIVANSLGYGQRSFNGVFSDIDDTEAEMVGREAVRLVFEMGEAGKMISIVRRSTKPYEVSYEPVELSDVAKPGEKLVKLVPREFFDTENQPNADFVEWVEPLLGDIDDTGFLELRPVRKILS
ncbi:MAG: diphosphate--fructose-6-phosphate 1-phosphotransferase [Candidatus Aenigmarchaeota archaeon]|nr:diphosphate--fructose-6-phosphate 1-phosphotransferase [Candidatus Aenigmarchaeota archaeon]